MTEENEKKTEPETKTVTKPETDKSEPRKITTDMDPTTLPWGAKSTDGKNEVANKDGKNIWIESRTK